MVNNLTQVTPREIVKFRAELIDYPSAITALDVIEECEGYLEDAVQLLLMRETGTGADRSFDNLDLSIGLCQGLN
jgi:hypothetical protein